MTTTIDIEELQYIDPRAGNDKFYRTFVFGSSWLTQYGRNGTSGTFTKLVEAASPEAAQKAASAKFSAKLKKGYNPARSGTLTTNENVAQDPTILDELARRLPEGPSHTVITEPVNAVPIEYGRLDDQTAQVARALDARDHHRTTDSDLNPALPIRPMLASVQDPNVVAAAMSGCSWSAQYKYDGDRVVIEISNSEIRVLNRQGQEKTRNIGSAHLLPFTALHAGRWVFDGEVVGRTLVLFDVVNAMDETHCWVQEDTAFSSRYGALLGVAHVLGIPHVENAAEDTAVVIAPLATTPEDKDRFLATAVAEKREGIVLRDNNGAYEPGRRSTTLIKHKLIKDADVIITELHASKESATLSVHDDAGNLIEVGAASTIGKGDMKIGDVWVVTFLYVTDPAHPRLFQPRLVNQRDDKAAADCLLDQFADAGTAKVV